MKKVKTGDIYTLGEHRLICGDCRELETINKLMNGRRANLVFTDPPYGMKKAGVANDNMNLTDMLAFNGEWIQKSMDVLDSNGSWYCWGKDEQIMLIYATILRPMIERNEIVFRNLITWEKPSVPGQLSDTHRMYPVADEKCLFVMKGTQGFNNNADGFYEEFEPIRSYLDEQRKIMGWTAKDIRNITGVTSVARWILEDNTCRCSACGFDRGESLFAFCPICGAEILGAG